MSDKYTLGIDVGTNSIGWAILKLNESNQPIEIKKLGSRIFTDGRDHKTKTTLAAHRRQKRQERRRRSRLHERKRLIIKQLISMGLFPPSQVEMKNLKSLDVLPLRARAVTDRIAKHELGRVIYHLSLKRGFKSNRKGESAEDKKNKISERIQKLKDQMESLQLQTVGQYLNHRYSILGLSTKAIIENDFHLLRELIENEFDLIVDTQKKFYHETSDEEWSRLREYIFHQRPLKPVETGPCSIYPEKNRTFKYMPSFEEYRFLTELFNLSYRDESFHSHCLSKEQIFKAFDQFKSSNEVSYTKLKKFLNIPHIYFSIEKSQAKEKIKISITNRFFSHKDLFGESWSKLSLAARDKVADAYFSTDNELEISNKLKEAQVSDELIKKLLSTKPPAISDVTCSFSAQALQRIVSLLLEEGRHPTLIVKDLQDNELSQKSISDYLGYYGAAISESTQPIPKHILGSGATINEDERRFGRIANPTVHAALRQIEKVLNDIFKNYGKPENIHIEFARDLKKSKEERMQELKKNNDNKRRNEAVQSFIREHGQKPTAYNFERVKLWFELDAMKNQICIYSGRTISARMVLTDEVQVDHILPFSRTLDDGFSNKVLVLASENVKKGNKTPYEAFGRDENKWIEIQERAKLFPYGKQWKFEQNAIQRFEENNNFLARHLNDTRYISKIAKKYLETIIDSNKIVVGRGQLTSIIRGKLGLNQFIQNSDGKKDRDDHRHHAIDALAVALSSRSYLKKISDATAQNSDPNRIEMPEPWPGFIGNVRDVFENIIVSHKTDHGTNGPFMEETCFGIIKEMNDYEKENDFKLVVTKPLSRIKDVKTIRDPLLRKAAEEKGVETLHSLGVKRLRTYQVSKEAPDKIGEIESGIAKITNGQNGEKYYQKGDINHLTIWYLPKEITLRQNGHKKRKSDYIFFAIKTFDLNSRNHNELKPHPAAKLITRVFKGDTVAIGINELTTKYYIVRSINPSNSRLEFLAVNRAKENEFNKQFRLAYSKLQESAFRKIHVTPSGNIVDHGPILK